jgi:serpin B
MAYFGARGVTASEMERALQATLDPAALGHAYRHLVGIWSRVQFEGLTLQVANRLFIEKTLEVQSTFLKATSNAFGSCVDLLDFAHAFEPSRRHINDWVAGETRGRILELIPADTVTEDTRLVLVNAVYFKSRWRSPFQREATRPEWFFVDEARRFQIPMMTAIGTYAYRRTADVEIVEIPYDGPRFSMAIVLPRKRDGLALVESRLTPDTVGEWFDGDAQYERVLLRVPRFKVNPRDSLKLKPALSELGMPTAFDRERADFTGIHVFKQPEDRLSISDVFHQAFVEVDEHGTEAAAATAVRIVLGSPVRLAAPRPFVADHPFLFLLRDFESGMVMFLGRVSEPLI